MSNTSARIRKLAVNGLLSAVICIISFLPIRTLGLEITLSMVPVAIGASLYGAGTGAVLGGVFGLVSFIQCFGYSPFGAALLGMNMIYTAIICIPTRMLAGFLAGLAAKAVAKITKKESGVLSSYSREPHQLHLPPKPKRIEALHPLRSILRFLFGHQNECSIPAFGN